MTIHGKYTNHKKIMNMCKTLSNQRGLRRPSAAARCPSWVVVSNIHNVLIKDKLKQELRETQVISTKWLEEKIEELEKSAKKYRYYSS